MANFYAQYPASASGANPSVGRDGQTAPLYATEIGGVDGSGNLIPVAVDSAGVVQVNITGTVPTPLPVTDAAAEASLASLDSKTVHVDTGNVTVVASALPTGAATAANQTSQITQETAIAASVASLDSKTVHVDTGNVTVAASALPSGASTAANQTNVQSAPGSSAAVAVTVQGSASGVALPVALSSVPLPTGAATAANQTNGSQKTQIVDGSGNVIASTSNALNVDVVNFPATQPVSGTVTVVQPTGTNLHAVIDSSALPTGAATSANQATEIASLSSIDGKLADNYGVATGALRTAAQVGNASGAADFGAGNSSAQTLRTVIASNQTAIPTTSSSAGKAVNTAPVYTVYSSTPVTTSAYTQLVASTSAAVTHLSIFDSSGQGMILATGAAASEVVQLYIQPGGGEYDLAIPSGTRIAIKALTATASNGYQLLNMLT